ncbi:MAG TPA: dipeptide epimerase [Verrucomicrobiales bacterium]|nr:dipeptide epimerase [Verrucomicrobiales bacterium]
MELKLTDLRMPMRHPFTIAHGTTTLQHNLLVELRQDGVSGYGECASSTLYGSYTAAAMRAELEAARATIEAVTLDDPMAVWDRLFPVLGHNRFALNGLDAAMHDLWGKLRGQPTWKLLGLELKNLPLSNYTIGIDSIDRMVAKMKEFDGWPIYKIKLGTTDDLAIVRALRQHTDAVFRIDANCAWTADQTIALAPRLKELGVEFLEQPLKREDWAGMERVVKESALPVIADESCIMEDDVDRCAGCFHGINIKLCKAGGMTPARRMIARGRELGLKIMIGCMNESSAGISAIGQLLPLLDYVDMDGAVLIAKDPVFGVRLDRGVAVFPDANGNGVSLL